MRERALTIKASIVSNIFILTRRGLYMNQILNSLGFTLTQYHFLASKTEQHWYDFINKSEAIYGQ